MQGFSKGERALFKKKRILIRGEKSASGQKKKRAKYFSAISMRRTLKKLFPKEEKREADSQLKEGALLRRGREKKPFFREGPSKSIARKKKG